MYIRNVCSCNESRSECVGFLFFPLNCFHVVPQFHVLLTSRLPSVTIFSWLVPFVHPSFLSLMMCAPGYEPGVWLFSFNVHSLCSGGYRQPAAVATWMHFSCYDVASAPAAAAPVWQLSLFGQLIVAIRPSTPASNFLCPSSIQGCFIHACVHHSYTTKSYESMNS